MKKSIFVYLISVTLLVVISSFLSSISMDGIWCHGFSYNIASGLVPYRDFNMVIGPAYSLLISIFIKLFGNYMLVFNITHSLIFSIIMVFVYQKLNKHSLFLIIALSLSPTMFGYNTFCAFLVIGILILEDSNIKYNNILIGIVIGIIIMTKHNIGLCLALVYLFTNKKRISAILSMLISIVPIILYLIVNDVLIQYIDFCYLGLGNFLDNFYIDFVSIIVLIIVIYILLKKYFKEKDNKILYVLAFLVVVFPIVDQGHVIPALIPVTYYLLLEGALKIKFYLKYYLLVGLIMIIFSTLFFYGSMVTNDSFLKYQRVTKNVIPYLNGYWSYIDNNKDKKIYIFLDNAYMIKLYRDENPSFYDLINDGNLGSEPEKYIDLLDNECKAEKCIFILDNIYFKKKVNYTQISPLFKNYVLDNASYLETLPSKDRVYVNY